VQLGCHCQTRAAGGLSKTSGTVTLTSNSYTCQPFVHARPSVDTGVSISTHFPRRQNGTDNGTMTLQASYETADLYLDRTPASYPECPTARPLLRSIFVAHLNGCPERKALESSGTVKTNGPIPLFRYRRDSGGVLLVGTPRFGTSTCVWPALAPSSPSEICGP